MSRGVNTQAGNTLVLHRPHSGIDPEAINGGVMSYAGQLARYITDPSTIRVRTMERFGKAPSIGAIQRMQMEHRAERSRYARASARLGENDWDAKDFRVAPHPDALIVSETKPVPVPIPTNDDGTVVKIARHVPRTAREIIAAVCADLGQSVADVMGKSRKRPIVLARRTAAYVLHKRGNSYPQVGMFLGGVDHSSIFHAVREFERGATDEMRSVAAQYYREAGE